MNHDKIDIEKYLNQGEVLQIEPQGNSMYPFLIQGRDKVILKKTNMNDLKRGDVVLYRRDNSILVLHRIWKRKEENFYMVGDNQTIVEGPIRKEQIRGTMTGFVHLGKTISARNPVYVCFSRIWLSSRPIRSVVRKWK